MLDDIALRAGKYCVLRRQNQSALRVSRMKQVLCLQVRREVLGEDRRIGGNDPWVDFTIICFQSSHRNNSNIICTALFQADKNQGRKFLSESAAVFNPFISALGFPASQPRITFWKTGFYPSGSGRMCFVQWKKKDDKAIRAIRGG